VHRTWQSPSTGARLPVFLGLSLWTYLSGLVSLAGLGSLRPPWLSWVTSAIGSPPGHLWLGEFARRRILSGRRQSRYQSVPQHDPLHLGRIRGTMGNPRTRRAEISRRQERRGQEAEARCGHARVVAEIMHNPARHDVRRRWPDRRCGIEWPPQSHLGRKSQPQDIRVPQNCLSACTRFVRRGRSQACAAGRFSICPRTGRSCTVMPRSSPMVRASARFSKPITTDGASPARFWAAGAAE